MMRTLLFLLTTLFVLSGEKGPGKKYSNADSGYELFETYHQIHILKNGNHVASYLYDSSFLKPILYPVHSPSGFMIERRFPFAMIEGESHDHPHHTGIFFTYGSEGEVNGNSFWANQQQQTRIRHRAVEQMQAGSREAILRTKADWIGRNGNVILEEDRTMTFSGNGNHQAIDFSIRLKAIGENVVFRDTKEGMFGIRVADWLSEDHGTGTYLNSNGDTAEAGVWGKRAEWVRLQGTHEGRTVGIVIMNHPGSVNYPTYWHARGYGLFAANPLGQSVFLEGHGIKNPEPFNFTIRQGDTAHFLFRMIVYEENYSPEEIETDFQSFGSSTLK